MTVPLLCVLVFSIWTVTLVVAGVGAHRVLAVVSGRAASDAFPADQDHGGPAWYRRCIRAHMNCVENLPVFASVVLVGSVIGLDDPTLDTLALVYVGARVLQSAVHISSTSVMAINVRFGFFVVQLTCLVAYVGWIGFAG